MPIRPIKIYEFEFDKMCIQNKILLYVVHNKTIVTISNRLYLSVLYFVKYEKFSELKKWIGTLTSTGVLQNLSPIGTSKGTSCSP